MKKKSNRTCILWLLVVLTIVLIPLNQVLSQNSKVYWSSFNMGYAASFSTGTMVRSAVGQSFVGNTHQGSFYVESGFLADTLFRGTVVDVREEPSMLPTEFRLYQNYPNPFNPSTTIHFEIPKESHVTLKVYNMLGQEVLTVMDEEKVAGRYDLKIDGESLASGVFFYRLQAGTFTETRKLILIK